MTNLREDQISNEAAQVLTKPFMARVRIQGTQDILFHRWDNEVIETKAAAKKGSREKKIENPETYVYRNVKNEICIPGRYIVRAVVEAGRNFQDPRSSRRMAKDLVQAAVMCNEINSPILVHGKAVKKWEYEDRQRVVVMRAGITRTRPAFFKGWEAEFNLISLVPELITPDFLRKLVDNAGLLIGLGDYRPTYGRFRVVHWEVLPYVSADAYN